MLGRAALSFELKNPLQPNKVWRDWMDVIVVDWVERERVVTALVLFLSWHYLHCDVKPNYSHLAKSSMLHTRWIYYWGIYIACSSSYYMSMDYMPSIHLCTHPCVPVLRSPILLCLHYWPIKRRWIDTALVFTLLFPHDWLVIYQE